MSQLITYVKATNTDSSDNFGHNVALSGDGLTLAVSAVVESSNAVGVNGNGADNSAPYSGAVYVYGFDGERWEQQAYIKASNSDSFASFGQSIDLSDDGRTLAVSANNEDSSATGIDGDQSDNSALHSGAVYLYRFDGRDWGQEAYIKATNTDSNDDFGVAVSLSGNGNVLAVGATHEESQASGVNGNQTDNTLRGAGAVYLYRFNGQNWLSDAYIKASNTGQDDAFGSALSLSNDGSRLAVSATGESSDATGVNGDETNDSASDSGAVYVYDYDGQAWSQQTYIKASNTDTDDYFGISISLSGDGETLAVGSPGEDSRSTSINGDELDNTAADAGAVYLYRFSGQSWGQEAYIKASNTDAGDYFGFDVSLSENGDWLAVGAIQESSMETGITLSSSDNSAGASGAAYLYHYDGNSWMESSYYKSSNSESADVFGYSVSISSSGHALAVSAYLEDSESTDVNGNQQDNNALDSGAVYIF
ncbi:hypothetical protein BIT28_05950 [Photobacterium proteolyticum]|uniref:Integrin n=1 Tax=Photobacterium proteolyticum TaxID=1903952 RepID=A0A1Q9GF05_9GAMM|nr:hypothetical protein BIT28_05950 [Photobacterium proteolyticum]